MRVMGLVVVMVACGDEPTEPICPPVAAECTPQYEPVFDSVYTNTIQRSCGVGANSCHGAGSTASGLDLSSPMVAHEQLLEKNRVIPNDPACSVMVQRMNHSDPSLLMPPGSPLSAAEICSVQKWIEAGATW